MVCLIAVCSVASGQELTTWGNDFWLAFLSNNIETDLDTYTIAVSGPRACSVVVENPNTGWSNTLTVAPNQVTKYTLPREECWQSGSYITTNKGLHITSTDEIQLLAFNKSQSAGAADATTVLPTRSLSTEYIVQTYPVNTHNPHSQCLVSVLATYDSTVVDIYPTAHYSQGAGTGSDTHITVTLNAGQVSQLKSSINDGTQDFSGTRISSQQCLPVAVFSGATLARIPISAIANDHLFAQNIPVSGWGSEWILTPAVGHEHDYARVTASTDNCIVYINGVQRAELNSGQTYEFDFTNATHLLTSKPAGVFQYLISRTVHEEGGDYGDCSMFAPNALTQQQKAVNFGNFTVDSRSPSVSKYYVNIVVPNSETDLLKLDNDAIRNFSTVGTTGYAYSRVAVTPGSHTLTTTGSGFVAHTYGLGENWESYIATLGGIDTTVYIVGGDLTVIDTTVDDVLEWDGQILNTSGSYFFGDPCEGGTLLRLFIDCPPQIWPPNVFTPGKETNNIFRIPSKNISQMTVDIYQRWGDKIYTFNGLTEGWDGTRNGLPCPQETYVYRITYRVIGSHETPNPIVGTVTLLR